MSKNAIDGSVREQRVARVLTDNYTQFLAFLERRVESREVAEDILQDAFVRGFGRAASVRNDESVSAWFYRILRNGIADHYRRHAAEARVRGRVAAVAEPFEAGPDDDALLDQVCGCVRELVDTLKPEYARAVRRVDIDGTAIRVWADEENITTNNAAVRLHRARDALRRQVIRTCGTCSEHGCVDCTCGAPVVPTS
ncbi:MAG: RNA polymerase sigma factor [Longimicrobiales bacterium]